jgi:cobalt-zinc-cadmium efflux system outer membrane protein
LALSPLGEAFPCLNDDALIDGAVWYGSCVAATNPWALTGHSLKAAISRMVLHSRIALCATVLALGIATTSFAREVSLEQAIAIALESNPDLAAAAKELVIAQSELQRASYISQFNPELRSDADYRNRSGRSNAQDWRISFSQQLEVFGQPVLRRQSAHLGYQRTSADVRNQVRLLTAAVRMTFYEALRARRQIGLLGELEALNQRLAEAAQTRFEAGEISQIDFNLARVRYGESRRALIDGRERYRLERSSLGRLLGRAVGPEPEPAAKQQLAPAPVDVERLFEIARANRPDLKAAQLEIARVKTEAELNNKLALPNPTLGTFFGHEQNTERFGGISAGLSIPLFNRRQAEATALAGRLAQAQERLHAAELNVERDVRDAYQRYLAALAALRVNQADVVTPARESFALLEAAFKAGKLDLLSLSLAERQAFEARMGYVDAWFNFDAAKVGLCLAIGGSL